MSCLVLVMLGCLLLGGGFGDMLSKPYQASFSAPVPPKNADQSAIDDLKEQVAQIKAAGVELTEALIACHQKIE
jgi:hypothetical protein